MRSVVGEEEERTRGAVLPEFVIAIVPVLMMFFCWVQLAWVTTANLLVQHAASSCARAAAVIGADEINPGGNGGEGEIQLAAKRAAEVQNGAVVFDGIGCAVERTASMGDPYGRVTATVSATYRCRVPLGKLFVCPGGRQTLTKKASMPFQGARYAE